MRTDYEVLQIQVRLELSVVFGAPTRYTSCVQPARLVIADHTGLILRAVSQTVADCCPGVEVVGEAKD